MTTDDAGSAARRSYAVAYRPDWRPILDAVADMEARAWWLWIRAGRFA